MQSLSKKITWNKDALSIEGLTISIGGKRLITESDVKISVGERVGLLGRNGCGKTMLFSYFAAQKQATPCPWSVFEVVQELPSTNQSITNVVLAAHLERGLMWSRRSELELLEDMSSTELEEYNGLCEKLDAMRADADSARAKIILRGLGFSLEDLEKGLNTFSGGWKARVALACGLFMEPDLLLLDEPTNHLDLNAVLWLTEFCKNWKKTLIVITHNSYFAANVCTNIVHINQGRINSYKCRYNRFVQMHQQNENKAISDWAALEKEVARLKGTGILKNKKAAEDLIKTSANKGIVRPPKCYKPKFMFDSKCDSGGTALLDITEGAFSYGKKRILSGINYALYPNTRSVLVGANGAGKSTLLKLLIGELEPTAGSCQRRAGLNIKYFNQHFYHDLPAEDSPIDYVSSQSKKSQPDVVRKLLGSSGLEGEAHTRKISTLSGGQKARVYFAGLVISEPDILLLDEPTNHLDMETTEGLCNGLKSFSGAVVIVSHDLDFLETLGTEVWLIVDGQVKRLGEGIDGLDVYVNGIIEDIKI